MNKKNIYTNRHQVKRKRVSYSLKSLKTLFFKALKFFLAGTILTGTFFLLLTIFYALDLPDISVFFDIRKNRNVTMINEKDEIVASFGDIHSNYIMYEDLPQQLVDALIATEDRRFFNHIGIDFIGLARAFYKNYTAGQRIQGGSTITQQLAKIAFLSPEKTLKRKIQELLLSFYLEQRFTKEQILTAYLNRVYLGSGVFGIDAAAKFYFDKDIKKLNLLESAILIGMLKAPTRYSPIHNAESSGKRAYQILLNMKESGYIDQDQLAYALREPVLLQTNKGLLKTSYFASYSYDQINYLFPDTGVDLIVRITLNENLQEYCQSLIKNYITKYGIEKNITQGAAIVLDRDGKIIAMVGGVDYSKSPFNRAVQAKRQAGSAFKHIIYTNAFLHGMTQDTIIIDKPIKYGNWQPRNNSRKFYGEVDLREAFARSLNTVSIQLTQKFGINSVIELANSMGISSSLPNDLTIALGTTELSLLELATSYSVITNDGYLYNPFSIIEVKDKENNILFNKNNDDPELILDKATNHKIKDLLHTTILQGSGRNAHIEHADIGGKTGTSQNFRDAWFIGFYNHYTIGVWLGNDDNSPMKGVGGASYPSHIFKDIATHLR